MLGAYPQVFRAGRGRGPRPLTYWTAAWLERIKGLYAAHEELTAAWNAAAAPRAGHDGATARWDDAQAAWNAALTAIDETRKKQMAAPGLAGPARKALATLDREWDGLARTATTDDRPG